MGTRVPLRKRFYSRVRKEPDGGCWIWTGSTDGRYGQIYYNGKSRKAHRVSWYLTHGEWPPEDMQVCHTCDVTQCVNPEHLFLGTMSDNIKDAVRKGRYFNNNAFPKTHCKRGHEFSGDNVRTDATGRRYCRECDEIHNERLRQKRRKARANAFLGESHED